MFYKINVSRQLWLPAACDRAKPACAWGCRPGPGTSRPGWVSQSPPKAEAATPSLPAPPPGRPAGGQATLSSIQALCPLPCPPALHQGPFPLWSRGCWERPVEGPGQGVCETSGPPAPALSVPSPHPAWPGEVGQREPPRSRETAARGRLLGWGCQRMGERGSHPHRRFLERFPNS